MRHFTYFPKIEYSDQTVVNLTVRAKIRDAIKKEAGLSYDYVIKDGDRADILATKYYGNSDYTWLIYYANDIFDPLFDWPLNVEQFNDFIVTKYGSIEKAQSLLEEPHHYLLDNKYIIDKITYEDINLEASRKKKVTNYQYEQDLNEEKRSIKIIDSKFARNIINEMSVIFK